MTTLSKKTIATQLASAFAQAMPDQLAQQDTTVYAAMLNRQGEVIFRPDAFSDPSIHTGQPTAVTYHENVRIIGYFSAYQLRCLTDDELAELIEDDELPYS